jgi:hypothetical protein
VSDVTKLTHKDKAEIYAMMLEAGWDVDLPRPDGRDETGVEVRRVSTSS